MRLIAVLALLLSACCTLTAPRFSAQAAKTAPVEAPPTIDVGQVDETLGLVELKFKQAAEAGAKHVTLRIDSPGGDIFVGLRFIRDLEDLKKLHGVTTTCVVDGTAYSMAAIILESPACDERVATVWSTVLFHNGHAGGKGTAAEIKDAVRMLEALNTAMAALVAQRLGLTPAQYRGHVDGGDWVMAADEALANHVIDRVVPSSSIAPPGVEVP